MCSSGNRPAQATANSVIASAKRLIDVRHFWCKQQQDGRDQRAGVADADPPHEVDDGEAPGHRDVDAPDADALEQQIADGVEQHHHEREGDGEADPPAARRPPRQRDGADLVRDRAEGVARPDDGRRAVSLSPGRAAGAAVSGAMTISSRVRGSGCSCTCRVADRHPLVRLGSRTYIFVPVPGSDCAGRPGTSCAAACSVRQQGVVERLVLPLLDGAVLSLRSPKMMAWAGQTAWQAVIRSPSVIRRPSFSASISATRMRCTQ